MQKTGFAVSSHWGRRRLTEDTLNLCCGSQLLEWAYPVAEITAVLVNSLTVGSVGLADTGFLPAPNATGIYTEGNIDSKIFS